MRRDDSPMAGRHLALADDPRVFPSLGVHANFVLDRLHRDRDLVGDLQRARQHGEGEGCAIIMGLGQAYVCVVAAYSGAAKIGAAPGSLP
jgi:hypothetical protein